MINFPYWKNKGITYLDHLFEGTEFITFARLNLQYGINKNKFLEYEQIKAIIRNKFKHIDGGLIIPTKISEFLELTPPKLLSKLYRTLTKLDDPISLPITKWEEDLSVSFEQNIWAQICLRTFNMTRNPNLQLIQYQNPPQSALYRSKIIQDGFCTI